MAEQITQDDLQRLMELSQTIGDQQAMADKMRGQQAMYDSMGTMPKPYNANGVTVAPSMLETLSSVGAKAMGAHAGAGAYGAEGAARGAQDQQNQMLMAALMRQQGAAQAATQPTQPTMARMPAPNAAFQAPQQTPAPLGSGMYGIQ